MSSIATTAFDKFWRMRSDHRWMSQLKECERKIEQPLKQLSPQQKDEIREYYAKFGFKKINFDWHRYIYSVSGQFAPEFLPEDFFHGVLENTYNNRNFYGAWEDKAFMPYILDSVRFPEVICFNANGYFYNSKREMISQCEAEKLVCDCGDAFAKPTLASGGGKGAYLVNNENTDEVFKKLQKNFVVQKKIIQSSKTAAFNPSSVNTVKMVSFMFHGEVHILTAIMRVGGEFAITDAAASGKGYFLGINDDGTMKDFGMSLFGKIRDKDYYGDSLKGRFIPQYKEMCEIVKNAHRLFPYFGFMSWDFCINDKEEVILIEYNTGYPVALVYQMVTGPFMGDLTSAVLADAAKKYFGK